MGLDALGEREGTAVRARVRSSLIYATCFIVALLVLVASSRRHDEPADAAITITTAPTTTVASTTSTVTTAPPSTAMTPDAHPPDPDYTRQVYDATVGFVNAWLLHDTEDARRTALEPYTGSSYIEMVVLSDPELLPPQNVLDVTVVEVNDLQGTSQASIEGGMRVECHLVRTAIGWRVDRHYPI